MRRAPGWLAAAAVAWLAAAPSGATGPRDPTAGVPGPAPVRCGMRWLAAERAAGRLPALPQRADAGSAGRRAAVAAPLQAAAIEVGTQLEFPLYGSVTTLTATCRRVGTRGYVFVENRHWDTSGGSILQRHVDELGVLFDAATPADAERGLYELETAVFGPAPDVDGDPRVFLLVAGIPDPNTVGFFDPQVPEHLVPELRRDVVYLDEAYLRLRPRLTLGTLAHEFQHLIHWGHDADEEPWVDEGLSGYAEELAGYPEADTAAVPEFLRQPWTSLTDWPLDNPPRAYGATYLFMSFLVERHGVAFLQPFVAQARNGIAGLDAALEAAGQTARFADLWADWSVANYATADPAFAYGALAGRRVTTFDVDGLPLPEARGSVAGRWATANLLLRTPGDVVVDFDGDDSGAFRVWAYAMGPGPARLEPVQLDAANRGSARGSGIDSLAVIIGRTPSAAGGFTVSARTVIPTAVGGPLAATPAAPALGHAYPNPFNSAVRIPYAVTAAAHVEVSVYDLAGQRLRRLAGGAHGPGAYEVVWDGRDETGRRAATGTYLLRLRAPGVEQVASLALLR